MHWRCLLPSLCFLGVLTIVHSSGWLDAHYIGCFRDAEKDDLKVLGDSGQYFGRITVEYCWSKCTKNPEMYFFGLEQLNMCYCGRKGSNYSLYGESKDCTSTCAGNSSQLCGGHFAIAVYKTVLECDDLHPPLNGHVNQTKHSAHFGCSDGFFLEGEEIIYCNESNYEWTGRTDPDCYKSDVDVVTNETTVGGMQAETSETTLLHDDAGITAEMSLNPDQSNSSSCLAVLTPIVGPAAMFVLLVLALV